MSISYIDSTGTTSSTARTNTGTTATKEEEDNTSFTQSDFIALMVEELTNQDPTTPTSTSELMTQLTQMQDINSTSEQAKALTAMTESLSTMNDSFEELSENMDDMVEQMTSTMDDFSESMDNVLEDMNEMIDGLSETMDTMSELMDTNNTLMYAMVFDNTFQNACSLTGSYVTGTDSEGNALEGKVSAAFISNQVIYLALEDGSAMPYSNLSGVAEDPSALEATDDPAATTV